jgi:S1-C subfamily serine protease
MQQCLARFAAPETAGQGSQVFGAGFGSLERPVEQIEEGGRAQNAGITTGDVIVEVDRQPVAGVEALEQALKRHPANAPVLLLVHRDGHTLYLTVA